MKNFKVILFVFCLIIVVLPLVSCETNDGGQVSGDKTPISGLDSENPDVNIASDENAHKSQTALDKFYEAVLNLPD